MFIGEFLVPINVKTNHVHGERAGADGNFLADASEADDADGLFQKFVAGLAFPTAAARGVGVVKQTFFERKQQKKSVFRNRRVIGAGREEQRDAEFGAGLYINFIHADAVFAQDLQLRSRFFQNFARDGVIAANVAVHIADERQRVGFVQRAARVDDFPAGLREQIVVSTVCVLERSGG